MERVKPKAEREREREQLIYDDASGTIILNMIIVTLFWSVCVCVERVLTKDAGNESENKLERYEKRVQNFVDDDDGSKKQERKVADREIKRGVCVCVC